MPYLKYVMHKARGRCKYSLFIRNKDQIKENTGVLVNSQCCLWTGCWIGWRCCSQWSKKGGKEELEKKIKGSL